LEKSSGLKIKTSAKFVAIGGLKRKIKEFFIKLIG